MRHGERPLHAVPAHHQGRLRLARPGGLAGTGPQDDHQGGILAGVDTFRSVLDHYAETLRAAGSLPRTVTARVAGVSLLGQSAGGDPRWASTRDVTAWLGRPDLAAWSKVTYYAHARCWFRFLVEYEYRADDPTYRLRRPKPPRGVPRPVTGEQVVDLLAAATGNAAAYVTLGAYAGLRVHEIAKIRGEDVSVTGLRVVGKGGHEAVIPTHPAVWRVAQAYPQRGYWFPSPSRSRPHVHADSVSTAVRRLMLSVGVDAHAHCLRHFFGTEVLRASGGDLRVAQELLRHASPSTTATYTMIDDVSRRAAVMRLPGA